MADQASRPGSEPGRAVVRPLLRAFAGFGVWSLCFVFLYGVQAIWCLEQFSLPPLIGKLVLLGIWILHAGLLLVWLCRPGLGRKRATRSDNYNSLLLDQAAFSFMRRLTVIIDATALTAVVFTGLPLLFLKVCV
jgi:hypothetical protein